MFFPFFYRPDERQQSPDETLSIKSLVRDFFTEPIPLPVWLWNLIVIVIYVQVIIFAAQLGLAAIVAIGLFLRSLF